MSKIQSNYLHLIITKYNIGLYQLDIDPDAWMTHRLSLFTNYCLPSVLNQACPHFLWIVFFDQQTPRQWLDRIIPLLSTRFNRSVLNVMPILMDCGTWTILDNELCQRTQEITLKLIPRTVRFLITSQLDSDDFLALNFSQRVQESLRSEDIPYVIDPELIYIVKEKEIKLGIADCTTRSPQSSWATPFFTVVEDRESAMTCLLPACQANPHSKIRQFISRGAVVKGCHTGRVVHTHNVSLREDGTDGTFCANETSNNLITKNIITQLAEEFGIDPARITKIYQQHQRRVNGGICIKEIMRNVMHNFRLGE